MIGIYKDEEENKDTVDDYYIYLLINTQYSCHFYGL